MCKQLVQISFFREEVKGKHNKALRGIKTKTIGWAILDDHPIHICEC
jgi:hypothetical protein